jgi:hypothetical protein
MPALAAVFPIMFLGFRLGKHSARIPKKKRFRQQLEGLLPTSL